MSILTNWVLEDILYVILGLLLFILQIYYIVLISKQLFRKVCDYKECLKLQPPEISSANKLRLIYNYKTVIIKNILLITILSVEFILYFSSSVATSILDLDFKENQTNSQIKYLSPNCSIHPRMGFYYHYPASRLLSILVAIMLCTLINLISLLTTFLKKRYYVHPFRTSLIRYIVWWSFQAIILLACCTIYTLPILFILSPSLALANWFYLIYESKQLAYILRARISDILNYEWDEVHYKQSRQAYRSYVVFSFIYAVAMLTLMVLLAAVLAKVVIKLVLLDQCFFTVVYGNYFPILQVNQNLKWHISHSIKLFDYYITPLMTYITLISLIFPLAALLIWKCLTQFIRNRMTPIRYTPIYDDYYYGNSSRIRLKVHRRKHLFWC